MVVIPKVAPPILYVDKVLGSLCALLLTTSNSTLSTGHLTLQATSAPLNTIDNFLVCVFRFDISTHHFWRLL